MSYTRFQGAWQRRAGEEYEILSRLTTGELLSRVREGRFGEYYQIWRVIGTRGGEAAEQGGWLLLDVLRNDPDYLTRYHCANALLVLLGVEPRTPAKFASEELGWPGSLSEIEAVLRKQVGPRKR